MVRQAALGTTDERGVGATPVADVMAVDTLVDFTVPHDLQADRTLQHSEVGRRLGRLLLFRLAGSGRLPLLLLLLVLLGVLQRVLPESLDTGLGSFYCFNHFSLGTFLGQFYCSLSLVVTQPE